MSNPTRRTPDKFARRIRDHLLHADFDATLRLRKIGIELRPVQIAPQELPGEILLRRRDKGRMRCRIGNCSSWFTAPWQRGETGSWLKFAHVRDKGAIFLMDVPASKIDPPPSRSSSNHAHLPAGSRGKLQRSVFVKTNFVTIGKRHLGDVVG